MGVFGDILGAGASLYEGSKNRSQSKKLMREQMTTAVQRRVEDAKKAGVHPLFALGASVGGTGVSVPSSGIGEAGRQIGNAIDSYKQGRDQKRWQERQDQVASAEINARNAAAGRDAAEAALLDSQRARLEQDSRYRGHDGTTIAHGVDYAVGPPAPQDPTKERIYYGPAKPENPRVPTQKAVGVQSGLSPLRQDFVDDDGTIVRFIAEGVGDEYRDWQIAAHEARRHGKNAVKYMRRWLAERGIKYKTTRKGKPNRQGSQDWVSP